MKDERLENALNAATHPIYMDTSSQVIDYYKDKYGESGWTRKIAEQIQPYTRNRAGTGPMTLPNIMRNFQGGRTPSRQIDFKTLGQELPPVRRELKPGQTSITITVRGDMHQGPKDYDTTEPITATATFSGNDAIQFINNPSYEDIYDDYGLDGDLHTDGDYEIAVASVSAS